MNESNSSFPKILFANEFRSDARALSDLIRQLLLNFPVANLHWWHCRHGPLYEHPDLRAASLHGFCVPKKLVPHQRWASVKSTLLETFWSPLAARHLERTISAVKPDLVWTFLGGWSIPVAARVRWPAVRRHVSVWDFPDANGIKRTFGAARSRRFVKNIRELVQQADSFDTICAASLAELQQQTGRQDGLIVHSGFEPHHLAALENAAAEPNETGATRLAYVGTIISESGFLDMLTALKTVRSQSSQKITLEFFGGRNYRNRAWFEPEWMTEHGMFTDDGLVAALRRCDWGIAVMDPAGEDLQYSRFSFPNKVGTYLSAGVPVLGFGHPTSSLAQIMQAHRFGSFTAATSRDEMAKFLTEAFRVASPRAFFREDILRCAHTEFNAAEMRAKLWRTIGVR